MTLQRRFPLALFAITLATAGCSSASDTDAPEPAAVDAVEALASANLLLADGVPAGAAKLVATDGRIDLQIAASGIEPGEHGFHLHQSGQCDAPDFKSAGGHLNPLGKSHGKDSHDGSHLGDLPNLSVNAEGNGTLTVPIEGEQAQIVDWLFDEDGTAVMIHAGPDDYITDPTGDAGGRVACGVLLKN